MNSSIAALVFGLAVAQGLTAAVSPEGERIISVRESRGVYTVTAQFEVPQGAETVRRVLTDFEQIPRFMPDVRTSRIVDRADGRVRVEQEAVARLLMFSKRIHLVLDVVEMPGTVRFTDTCGKSFASYQGAWTLTERDGRTSIRYELTARPAFDVPEFVLTRLLRRDAVRMVERLKAEFARAIR